MNLRHAYLGCCLPVAVVLPLGKLIAWHPFLQRGRFTLGRSQFGSPQRPDLCQRLPFASSPVSASLL